MTGPGLSCGACKFLRRKCTSECVFAPYFSYDDAAAHFAAVHKVFGASNVSKLLMHIPVNHRTEAAATIAYEALARMTDPVFGCVAHIFALHQQIANLQEEIDLLGSQMTAGYQFVFPGSQQPTENVSINQDAFNPQQQMDYQQVAHIINPGGYECGAADQSYVTQCQQAPAWGPENHSGNFGSNTMREVGEGLDQEALLFCPLPDNYHSVREIPYNAALGW